MTTMLLGLATAGCGSARAVDGRRCPTAAACESIHPAGIADPKSPDFHGALLRTGGWDFGTCRTCHGADFSGGTSGKSCLRCHADGPTACTTCHDLPPPTGAHAAHARTLDCAACHVEPARYDDVGHLADEHGRPIARARVTFGDLARHGGATPRWDGARCSGTYCHGDAAPAGNGGSDEARCGSCHGVPPPDHASDRCVACHGRVVDAARNLVAPALHVDGKISLGDDSGTCAACHPHPGGAHDAHLRAPHGLTAALDCTACHVVPATVSSPGHIDQPRAPVFGAGWSGLAARDGAQPAWDVVTARCSDVYCHGGGQRLGGDAAPSLVRQPGWSAGPSAAVCGACHGIPPVDAAHAPGLGLADCVRCHPTTMNASGGLIPGGTHLDGVIDAP